jgi:hypothetical protein
MDDAIGSLKLEMTVTMNVFYLYNRLPETTRSEKDIPLDAFIKHGKLGMAAANEFRYCFEEAKSMFVFQDKNNGKDIYRELHVVQITLHQCIQGWNKTCTLMKAVFQTIPHPVFLLVKYREFIQCFVADCHESPHRRGSLVVDNIYGTREHETSTYRAAFSEFMKSVVVILNSGKRNLEKHDLLRDAIQQYNIDYDKIDLSSQDVEDRLVKERLLSGNILKQEMKDGHVPLDWRIQYDLAPCVTYDDIVKREREADDESC